MKIYLLYIISSFLIFWLVLFNLGISAGFANLIPIFALFGSIFLFVGATPTLIYKEKTGLILGLVGCLMLLPYSFTLLIGIIDDGVFNLGLLIGTPAILVFISTYLSILYLFNKKSLFKFKMTQINKFLLAIFPIILFVIYFAIYGRYWNLSMFKI